MYCLFSYFIRSNILRPVENPFSPLTPKHGFPSQTTRHKALPFYPPETTRDRSVHFLPDQFKNKNGSYPIWVTSAKNVTGIPTLVLSKSGYRSKVTPSSQPVIQAPVRLIVMTLYSCSILIARRTYCNQTKIQDIQKPNNCSMRLWTPAASHKHIQPRYHFPHNTFYGLIAVLPPGNLFHFRSFHRPNIFAPGLLFLLHVILVLWT